MRRIKSILDFTKALKPISMLTCYDSTSAQILAKSKVDAVLVGDSVAMTMHGYRDTLGADLNMMVAHTSAVRRGSNELFIVADLPFLEHRKGRDHLVSSAQALLRAGANAIKIEGIDGSEDDFKYLIDSGVPVMAHLGLTPQFLMSFGGFKVQGRSEAQAEKIFQQALTVQKQGAFSVVLECVPTLLATRITSELGIPTIGIGAGADTDGQILVWQDVLGLNSQFKPKFVRPFFDGECLILQALDRYTSAVSEKSFPNQDESFK